jgi:hypothetical protein
MATTMTALNSPHIKFAEFVRLTLPSSTLTFCNAAAPVTVNGITFEGLGSLLGISEINRNVKSTSQDFKLSLTGIDPNNIALVLGQNLKGSVVEIWRGFLDDNNQIITTPTTQFFKRYQGIVNSMSIQEDFNEELRTRIATCVIASASMRAVLDARIAGIKTNQKSWQYFYPNDTSMDRVEIIASTYFDFGKAPIGGSQATPVASSGGGTEIAPDQSATTTSNDYSG